MQLLKSDLYHLVRHLPKDVRALMIKHGLTLGGGYIRAKVARENVSDIDLFGPNPEVLHLASLELATGRGIRKPHVTKNAITVGGQGRDPVQLITRWTYQTAQALMDSFDFTIAQGVVWFEKEDGGNTAWRSLVADTFYADLASRNLVYTCPQRNEDAGGSILRMRKFLMRGYRIDAPNLASVVARLMKGVKFDEMRMWDEGWGATVITGLLREVDPLTRIDGIDFADEEEDINSVTAEPQDVDTSEAAQ